MEISDIFRFYLFSFDMIFNGLRKAVCIPSSPIGGACISNSFLGFEFHNKLHILNKVADFGSCFQINEKDQTKGILFLVLSQSH